MIKKKVYHGSWQIIPLDLFIVLFCFPFPESQLRNTWQHPSSETCQYFRCLYVLYHRDKTFKETCSCYTIVWVQTKTIQCTSSLFLPTSECEISGSWALQTPLAILNAYRESWSSTDLGFTGLVFFSYPELKERTREKNVLVQWFAFPSKVFDLVCLFVFLFITLPFIFFGFLMWISVAELRFGLMFVL